MRPNTLRIYVSFDALNMRLKLTDTLDCCWPDATSVKSRLVKSADDLRRYVHTAQSAGWIVDTTDVQEYLQ